MNGLQKRIRTFAWISLVFVYLVITAGSIVRMTGSGMGCPDWPKCFGYTIPPTSVDQVTWTPERDFEKGQMIVHEWEGEERMLVAIGDFKTDAEFNTDNWKLYEKHDYSIFNPTHTWIEFINRLIGALTGVPVLILFVLSLVQGIRKKQWVNFLLAAGVLFMLGFEAWLGKLVVDGNLIPGSITIHMFGSMVLVLLLLLIIRRKGGHRVSLSPAGKWLLLGAFALTLLQILLGTQVREEIDIIAKSGLDREFWVSELPNIFLIHRSFSWVVLILTLGWLWISWKAGVKMREMLLAFLLLDLQIIAGVVLSYAGMPAFLQPVHLVGGILLFGVLWSAFLKLGKQKEISRSA